MSDKEKTPTPKPTPPPQQDVSDKPSAPDFGPVFTHSEDPPKGGFNLVEKEQRFDKK